jgi:hypothetical protein
MGVGHLSIKLFGFTVRINDFMNYNLVRNTFEESPKMEIIEKIVVQNQVK